MKSVKKIKGSEKPWRLLLTLGCRVSSKHAVVASTRGKNLPAVQLFCKAKKVKLQSSEDWW